MCCTIRFAAGVWAASTFLPCHSCTLNRPSLPRFLALVRSSSLAYSCTCIQFVRHPISHCRSCALIAPPAGRSIALVALPVYQRRFLQVPSSFPLVLAVVRMISHPPRLSLLHPTWRPAFPIRKRHQRHQRHEAVASHLRPLAFQLVFCAFCYRPLFLRSPSTTYTSSHRPQHFLLSLAASLSTRAPI